MSFLIKPKNSNLQSLLFQILYHGIVLFSFVVDVSLELLTCLCKPTFVWGGKNGSSIVIHISRPDYHN